jgi:hypothetical protein
VIVTLIGSVSGAIGLLPSFGGGGVSASSSVTLRCAPGSAPSSAATGATRRPSASASTKCCGTSVSGSTGRENSRCTAARTGNTCSRSAARVGCTCATSSCVAGPTGAVTGSGPASVRRRPGPTIDAE